MNYQYKVDYRNQKDGKDEGAGNISDMQRPIRRDVLELVSSLEKEYHNKHVHITVSTADFDISIISIQEI